jgi:F-type H+-transporting ATPase subunit delta
MTGDLSVARRYASALFELAKKRGSVDVLAANLQEVVSTVQGSRDLMSVLHHPLLTIEKKKAVLSGVFGGKIQPDAERFLFLVVEKQRANVLPQILEEFNRLVDEYRGEGDAEVTSAVPLSAAQVAALQASLQARFGIKVRLSTRIDPNILGGLVVRVGDKLIDASVATKLQSMNEQLKRVKVS